MSLDFRKNPFKSFEARAYVTAINILAVEYLIKGQNIKEYSRRCEQVYKLTDEELGYLDFQLSLNMHTSTLGAMITQNDYVHQRDYLFEFLDEKYSQN